MDRLSAIAQPELREVLLFVRAQARPVTAQEVARRLRVHRNVARGRLERLVQAELLVAAFERRTGRRGPGAGRPAKVYGVAPETQSLEFPRRRYESLVGRLLDALPDDGRPEALRQAGIGFGRDLADAAGLGSTRGVRSAVERVCAALGRLGFQATVAEVAGEQAAISTPTCPLRPLVVAHAQAVHLDHGMWIGLTESYLPRRRACAVMCETDRCLAADEPCRVLLRFTPANGYPPPPTTDALKSSPQSKEQSRQAR
ncbi:MAG TPA: hypothetical protein VFA44_06135 [Gaiellaceae bacterium]|nr:hypothetical protein [Gaiellaceae bacterium]